MGQEQQLESGQTEEDEGHGVHGSGELGQSSELELLLERRLSEVEAQGMDLVLSEVTVEERRRQKIGFD